MEHVRTVSLTFGLLIAVAAVQLFPAAEQAQLASTITSPEVSQPSQVIHTESGELIALGEWALGRYSQARLDLPNLDIYFHDTDEGCQGYAGLHRKLEHGSRIDLCRTTRTRRVEDIILHELGHAWAAHELTDAQRQAFITHQGLAAWNDQEADWNHRGTEHAADILAWGVKETHLEPRWIPDNDPQSLTIAYQLLTGTDPITEIAVEWRPRHPIPDHNQRSTMTVTSPQRLHLANPKPQQSHISGWEDPNRSEPPTRRPPKIGDVRGVRPYG